MGLVLAALLGRFRVAGKLERTSHKVMYQTLHTNFGRISPLLLRTMSSIIRNPRPVAVGNDGVVARSIQEKLQTLFEPVHLSVINESSSHKVPKNAETHFRVEVVSDCFEGKKPLERHRAVQKALDQELRGSVHALSIKASTVEQWKKDQAVNGGVLKERSPPCLGGDGTFSQTN